MKGLFGRPNRNLQHNRRQTIGDSHYEETGLIINQPNLKQWRYGAGTTDANGCGWIAIVNALQLLGTPAPPEEVIRWLEEQPPLTGLSLGGRMGTYFWGIARYFKAHGYRIKIGITPKRRRQAAAWGQVSIAFYARLFGGHFVAFVPAEGTVAGKPLYQFYNDRAGDALDIRRLDDLWKDNSAVLGVVLGIRHTPSPLNTATKE